MVEINDVTIISVTGVKAEESLWAIEHSCKNIKFAAAKLITPQDIKSSNGVEIIKCGPIDYVEYSRFVVYELWKYFDTSHVLLIQSDGFVVNPEEWTNEFLEYDYIGAPWLPPHDDFSYRDEDGNIQNVGNGGFSLRSKKLSELPSKLKLEWKSYSGFHNEDGFFSLHHRKRFEKLGCKYAPVELAWKFSQESNLPELDFTIPFGFHGRNHHYYNYYKNKICKK